MKKISLYIFVSIIGIGLAILGWIYIDNDTEEDIPQKSETSLKEDYVQPDDEEISAPNIITWDHLTWNGPDAPDEYIETVAHEKPLMDENGNYMYYESSGELACRYCYDTKGQRTGTWTEYYHDKIITECQMENDRLNGEYKDYVDGKVHKKYYFRNDTILSAEYYNIEEDTIYAYINYSYTDGQLTQIEEASNLYLLKNHYIKFLEGKHILKHLNGTLKKENSYKNNMLHGITKTYYNDGKTEWEIKYESNKRNGKSIKYSPSGDIEQEVYYVDDKPKNASEE